MEKSSVCFECILSKPNRKIKWFLKNAELVDENALIIKSENKTRYSLTLMQASIENTGTISCKVFEENNEILNSCCSLVVKGNVILGDN